MVSQAKKVYFSRKVSQEIFVVPKFKNNKVWQEVLINTLVFHQIKKRYKTTEKTTKLVTFDDKDPNLNLNLTNFTKKDKCSKRIPKMKQLSVSFLRKSLITI